MAEKKRDTKFYGIILLTSILISIFLSYLIIKRNDGIMRENHLIQARIITNAMDLEDFSTLTGSKDDITLLEYKKIKAQFASIKEANGRYRFIYLMGRNKNGEVFFFVDNEPAGSPDESEAGDSYDEVPFEFVAVFETGTEAAAGPVTDRWGKWITALIPIKDKNTGRLLAVLGLDIDASRWELEVVQNSALMVGLVILVGLFTNLFIQLRITHRKLDLNQIKLKKNESFLQSLLGSIPDSILILNMEGVIESVNQVYSGVKNEDIIGKSAISFLNQEYEKPFRDAIYKAVKTGELQTVEAIIDLPDGQHYFFIRLILTSLKENEKSIVLIATDITKLKNVEKELKKIQNYLTNIIDSMPSILIGVDSDGNVTQWNSEAHRTTGITVEEAVGQSLLRVFPRLSPQKEMIEKVIKNHETLTCHRMTYKKENKTIYEDLTIYPLIADGAEIRIDDVTEYTKMEELIIQSEKMVSVGGLAAGMAHEINNPLAGMMQSANVIANRLGEKIDLPANIKAAEEAGTTIDAIKSFMEARSIPRMLQTINDSGQRAAAIIDNMINFVVKRDRGKSSENIQQLMDQVIELAETDYKLKKVYNFRKIDIVKKYEENIPLVVCEGAKIKQVLLNLIRNGTEAMYDAKTEKPQITFHLWFQKADNTICMEIIDNGPGMDEELQKHIFEPFFTTKKTGEGTGLGLSISYFIITEDHRGEIEVESQPGEGSKFRIRLPVENLDNETE